MLAVPLTLIADMKHGRQITSRDEPEGEKGNAMERHGIFESIVGVFVIGVAVAFLFYAYGATGAGARNLYEVDAVFGRVDGVALGTEVRIAGVKVGSVTGNELDTNTYEARVKLAIADGVPIPDDSIAKIVSDGVLGGAHVAIEPGASEDMLEDGDVIAITQGSVDLLGLAVQAFTNPSNGGEAETETDPLGDF